MKHTKNIARHSMLGVLPAAVALLTVSAQAQTAQPWQAPYAGENATGSSVIGLWHFDEDAPGKDSSGKGHDLSLRGADSRFIPNGKFGGALHVEEKAEPGDKAQGAQTKDADDLTPAGAFTIEMWMSPSEQLAGKDSAFLLDKKYYNYSKEGVPSDYDYLLQLRKSGKDQFAIQAHLGFGNASEILSSTPQTLEAGEWYHVAFTYDGKGGAKLFLNGAPIGEANFKDRGAISNGKQNLVIGDRIGSTHQRFFGRIDEVRISNGAVRYASGKIIIDATDGRRVYYRKESGAKLQLSVFNDTLVPLQGAKLRVQAAGVLNKTFNLPTIAPGASTPVVAELDTALRPASYEVSAKLENAKGGAIGEVVKFPLMIVARPLPNQMPIVLWAGSSTPKAVHDAGFTGYLVNVADYKKIWDDGKGSAMQTSAEAAMRRTLDENLGTGVAGYATLTPGRYAPMTGFDPALNRVDRTGKPIDNADGLFPRAQEYSYDTGAAVARSFGDLPAFQGALIHTEIRDHTAPSFHDIDKDKYRKEVGGEIPPQIVSSRGVSYKTLPNFPADRVVPDNYPILNYYRWFWKNGDGWNTLHDRVDEGLKANLSPVVRKNFFTWFDPAVRAPSIWGSGGKLDYINQWTYTYPDPLKIGLAADEMFAMADGQPGQKVMNMTQIIWYRKQTTDTPKPGAETEWEKKSPDAQFISIAPDHLSEAMWLNLSRPVQAIAYHGWGSLGEELGYTQGSYVTTNLDTKKRLRSLVTNVVEPLAPTLLQVPDAPADVAFLESYASQILANRGTYGWGGGWGADSYMIARYAGLQPQIVYDETIQKNGLDKYKGLFLTDCDVLSQSVADAIKKFQARGGIVVGDEVLAPAIQPDILLIRVNRGKPDETKKLLLQKAAALRGELDAFYQLSVETDNPEIITRRRRFGSSDYVFTVNDNRTYGDYVGQYKKVMEKGLPSQGQISLNRDGGFVYDLMNKKPVPTTKIRGATQFGVNLGAGEGNVFLVTDKAAGALQVSVAGSAARGGSTPVTIQLSDNTGKPLQAVVPMEVSIRDPQNRLAEKSGFYGAANGKLSITLELAPNDLPGKWQIEVREGLRGQKVTKSLTVK
jgi:hypothetical protein